MPILWQKPEGKLLQEVQIRVRYADTDRMGVVYHANYLQYFESCRTELIRTVWKSYRQIEQSGWFLMVLEANCKYARSARYDDLLVVKGWVDRFTETRIRFDYQIVLDEQPGLLVEGFTEHCWTNNNGKPCRIPSELMEILTRPL